MEKQTPKHAVDFDGTLSVFTEYEGPGVVGEPIPLMVERVRRWLAAGEEVIILTARVHPQHGEEETSVATAAINKFCVEQFGKELPVTHCKDFTITDIWDDRAVRVVQNTGEISDGTDVEDPIVTLPEEPSDNIGDFFASLGERIRGKKFSLWDLRGE